MTTTITEPQMYQVSERGRRPGAVSRELLPVLDGGFYTVRRSNGRITIAWPTERGQATGAVPSNQQTVAELRGLGLDPFHFWVARINELFVEPMTPPQPEDRATYPDPQLLGLPLYRITAAQDNFQGEVFEFHREHLFRGFPTDSGRISIVVPREAATPENRLTHMYGLAEVSARYLQDRGITASTATLRKYTIHRGRYEEVPDTVVSVTAEPVKVKKMSKKELRAALQAEKQAHVEDMQKVSARLEREATERDWCATYDSVVNDLSRDLAVPLQPRRPKTRKRVTYQVTTPRTDTFTVYDDATPEQIEAEVLTWARRNVHASATVSEVSVE